MQVWGWGQLGCPPRGSARAAKPSAVPLWFCQGLPKPRSCGPSSSTGLGLGHLGCCEELSEVTEVEVGWCMEPVNTGPGSATSTVRVWDLRAWSLESPDQETLSPRSPPRANGGGRLRDLPQHHQLQLHQLHHLHVLPAALCQVGVKVPRATQSCMGTQRWSSSS